MYGWLKKLHGGLIGQLK